MRSTLQPKRVTTLSAVRKVACGNRHTLALTEDGHLYAFGSNAYGQLGTASGTSSTYPTAVHALDSTSEKVVSISAGDDFSVAVSDAGNVFTWGSATLGRLGHGTSSKSGVSSFVNFVIGETATCEHTPRLVRDLQGNSICSVYCGKHHTIALTSAGRAFAWGAGRHFQLGTGEDRDEPSPVESLRELWGHRVVKVSAGGMHSLILCANGRVYALGQNEYGCLGLGYSYGTTRATEVPYPVPSVQNAIDIAAGWHVSAAVVRTQQNSLKGKVLTWGSGTAGALGTGDPVDHWEPVHTGIEGMRVVTPADGAHVLSFDTE